MNYTIKMSQNLDTNEVCLEIKATPASKAEADSIFDSISKAGRELVAQGRAEELKAQKPRRGHLSKVH